MNDRITIIWPRRRFLWSWLHKRRHGAPQLGRRWWHKKPPNDEVPSLRSQHSEKS